MEPTPSEAEAIAVSAAIASVLDEEAANVAADPQPAAYRSAWRIAGLKDGVSRINDGGWG